MNGEAGYQGMKTRKGSRMEKEQVVKASRTEQQGRMYVLLHVTGKGMERGLAFMLCHRVIYAAYMRRPRATVVESAWPYAAAFERRQLLPLHLHMKTL